jgi:hypothetical protein
MGAEPRCQPWGRVVGVGAKPHRGVKAEPRRQPPPHVRHHHPCAIEREGEEKEKKKEKGK